jgi:hypothetical protein
MNKFTATQNLVKEFKKSNVKVSYCEAHPLTFRNLLSCLCSPIYKVLGFGKIVYLDGHILHLSKPHIFIKLVH